MCDCVLCNVHFSWSNYNFAHTFTILQYVQNVTKINLSSTTEKNACSCVLVHFPCTKVFYIIADVYDNQKTLQRANILHCIVRFEQGDQIGWIFPHWAVVSFGHFLTITARNFWPTFFLQFKLCTNFDKTWAGLHFGWLFFKLIWSPGVISFKVRFGSQQLPFAIIGSNT
jgi:hypothetical protein